MDRLRKVLIECFAIRDDRNNFLDAAGNTTTDIEQAAALVGRYVVGDLKRFRADYPSLPAPLFRDKIYAMYRMVQTGEFRTLRTATLTSLTAEVVLFVESLKRDDLVRLDLARNAVINKTRKVLDPLSFQIVEDYEEVKKRLLVRILITFKGKPLTLQPLPPPVQDGQVGWGRDQVTWGQDEVHYG